MSNKTIVNLFLYFVVLVALLVAGYSNLFFGLFVLVTMPILAIVLLFLLEYLEKINLYLPYLFISMCIFISFYLFYF